MENESNTMEDLNEEFVPESKNLSISEITEEILKNCGGFGPYQKKLTAFVILYVVFDALQFLTMVFVREKVPFACYPSNFNKSLIPSNITLNEFLDKITTEDDECSVYRLDMEEGFYNLPVSNSTKEPCSNGRMFNTKEFSTIVSEFDLVCEKEWMRNLIVSIMFVGVLIGSSVCGILSDKIGRFKTYCFSEIAYLICAITKINSTNYTMFVIMYFLEGFGQAGTFMMLYTILVECVSQNYRMPLNFAVHGIFALGEMLLAGLAYGLRDWKYLLYATCLPHIPLLIIAMKYLPESPRWLLSKRKFEKAKKSFNRIARANKRDDEKMANLWKLQREVESKSIIHEQTDGDTYIRNNRKSEKKSSTAIDLFKKPRRVLISTNLWFNWIVNSMLYYGVTLNSVDMSGNRYLNFVLISAVEIPAGFIGYIFFHWFGHRKPLCFFMVFAGLNCIVSNFAPKANLWLPLMLTVLGKLGGSASFNGIYLTSVELFPTVVRNSGIGIASSVSRVGAILAPQILGLSVYLSWLPLSIYGALGILGGFLILLLPEMKDSYLLETLEDMDNL
ncbi:organic cation transporter protein-like [Octopus sinensis]|uniref:Organic cation transporter protein-like n=1 Tax=Octopus sinensis TaxID=2607531 RepID=A0A6P7T1P5_9MOLL|nr:organic cation transporter protein-like [Octopus sinensis]